MYICQGIRVLRCKGINASNYDDILRNGIDKVTNMCLNDYEMFSKGLPRHRYLDMCISTLVSQHLSGHRHRYLGIGISISLQHIDIDTSTSVSRHLYLDIGFSISIRTLTSMPRHRYLDIGTSI